MEEGVKTGEFRSYREAEICVEYINKELVIPTPGVPNSLAEEGYTLDFGTIVDRYQTTVQKIRDCVKDFQAGYAAGRNSK